MQKQGTVRDVYEGNYLPSYQKSHRDVTENFKWNCSKCSKENQLFFPKDKCKKYKSCLRLFK